MKNSSKVFAFVALFIALSTTPAFAAYSGQSYARSSWWSKFTNQIALASTSRSWQKPKPTKPQATSTAPTAPKPATTTPQTPVPLPVPAGETRAVAYITGYGWPDNTPAGGNISNPVIHKSAGGTGTYADPITLAVGHSIIGGKDILDYPQGTKVYIPNLRKYFIVEDTCGDGNTPQNGACHTGYPKGTSLWLDVWVGGQGANQSVVYACESAITGAYAVIINPVSNYAVMSGPIYNGSCATQYGDTVVTQ